MKQQLWVFDSESRSKGYVSAPADVDMGKANIRNLRPATRRERLWWSLNRKRFGFIDLVGIAILAGLLRAPHLTSSPRRLLVTDPTEAQTRFATSPRPLNFIRVRLYRGGQAEYLRNLLADEVDSLFEDLGRLRGEGKHEDDPELIEVAANIRHLNGALKDINNGLVELAGPDGY